jgi:hypothetical protein
LRSSIIASLIRAPIHWRNALSAALDAEKDHNHPKETEAAMRLYNARKAASQK